MSFWVLCVAIAFASACHPECRWACDDPTCQAVCHPVCDAPLCIVSNATDPSCETYRPDCTIQCPPDMCESDMCPQCETVCQPPASICNDGTILCEATNCTWQCETPTNCPLPQCQLTCERPACESTAPLPSSGAKEGLFVGMLFLFAFISA